MGFTPARALIVEDEPITLADMRGTLSRAGLVVDAVSTGAQALEIARKMRPDMLIMDIRLQGDSRDGIDYAHEICDGSPISVCFVTAYADVTTIERASHLTPAAYLVKPFTELQLRAAVTVAVQQQRQSRELSFLNGMMRSMMDTIPTAMTIADATGQILFANTTYQRLFEYQEGASNKIHASMPPDIALSHDAFIERYLSTKEAHIIGRGREVQARARSGELVPAFLSVGHFRHDGKDYFIGVIEDLSPLKQAQARARETERLECFFTFSTGIAHHFNNLLTVIIGCITKLQTKGGEIGSAERDLWLNKASDAAARMARINRTLVGNFVDSDKAIKGIVKFASQFEDFVAPSCPREIVLRFQVSPMCRGLQISDADLLFQILSHCSRNAIEALRGVRGVIDISFDLTEVKVGDKIEVFGQQLNPGTYLAVNIQDSGKGMDADQLSRCFDPFFTTHTDGMAVSGKGLGLFQSLNIAKSKGGGMKIASSPEHGTIVSVYFPAVPRQTSTEVPQT
jgi:PAS domain S-box-containing protein